MGNPWLHDFLDVVLKPQENKEPSPNNNHLLRVDVIYLLFFS
jgi:hypothetical protein